MHVLRLTAFHETMRDIVWGLSIFIADGSQDKINTYLKANITPTLIRLSGHAETQVCVPCFRILGTLLYGDDESTG